MCVLLILVGTVNDFTVYLPTHVSLQSVFVGVPDGVC